MAINPDDFIFHSDLLYEQVVDTKTHTLSVTGTIGAGSSRTWATGWTSIPVAGAVVRGEVTIPGSVYAPNATNGRFPTPSLNTYNNSTNLQAMARIEQQNNRYRCVVSVINPYPNSISSPARTYTFKVSVYMPPAL